MNINEAIRHILENNAILFAGSGFSYGATNVANEAFPIGSELTRRMIEDGNLDVSMDSEIDKDDLGYISERYLEKNPKNDLLSFLSNQFHTKETRKYHDLLMKYPWKRIYTTNYDDLLEKSSYASGIHRDSVFPETNPSTVIKRTGAIVHINGYIDSVNGELLDSTFKLTSGSYRYRSIPDNDWAITLNNDIRNARCIVFIGYSLNYDLELQQIFNQTKEMKSKCIFVTLSPTPRERLNMERFGDILEGGVEKFANDLFEAEKTYNPEEIEYQFKCLLPISENDYTASVVIKDSDVTDLLISGNIKMECIFSSKHEEYIFTRTSKDNIVKALQGDYKAVIINSDLGNGKSVLMRDLEVALSQSGSVYYLNQINSYIQDDLDYITTTKGYKYIFIENYNRIIDSEFATLFSKYNREDIKYIFSVRTFINSNLFARFTKCFGLSEEIVFIEDINQLNNRECTRLVNLLNKYSLWGKKADYSNSRKMNYIRGHRRGECNRELKAVLLDLMNSKEIQRKINRDIEILFSDGNIKEIILLSLICSTWAVDLSLDEIVILLNKQVYSAKVLNNEHLRDLVDFRDNRVMIKSPIVALYILRNYKLSEDIVALIQKMLPVLDRNRSIERYKTILKSAISYSNLRMLFGQANSRNSRYYISIYEVGKNLEHNNENPFFWLQYAIATMDQHEYERADIYLNNAETYAKKRIWEDSWQIDTHRARFLLESTIYNDNKVDAFINFETAYHLLHDNKTPDMHYPLRQVSLFFEYHNCFFDTFTVEQKSLFIYYCSEMEKKMNTYLGVKSKFKSNRMYGEISRYDKRMKKLITIMAKSSK